MPATDPVIDERALSKLRWRCRRGLLENDLFIERFFDQHGHCITESQAQAMAALMDLPDNDLLDLLLARKTPTDTLDTPAVHALLALLKKSSPLPLSSLH